MKIAVYCGSNLAKNDVYNEAARELGRWMGQQGHILVYGGGEAGLMGLVAKEVFEAGCPVIGVVPENVAFIRDRKNIYVTELILTPDMSERKKKMFELADACIALPGGIGTMDEITEVITLVRIGIADKKSIFYNCNAYYEPMKQMFENMIKEEFFSEESMRNVLFSGDVKEIEQFLE